MRIVMTLLYLAGFIAISSASAAQESTAELRGRVLDAQGSAVPGVTIVITNQATGVYREIVSNADGTYFATALAPGTYSIDCRAHRVQEIYAQRRSARPRAAQQRSTLRSKSAG